jgi:hypothetical protein
MGLVLVSGAMVGNGSVDVAASFDRVVQGPVVLEELLLAVARIVVVTTNLESDECQSN